MEIMIELTDTELDAVVGGVGTATFDVSVTASAPFSTISGTLNIATTVSSASFSGSFYSEGDSV
jgi:bacteriocin-like protein